MSVFTITLIICSLSVMAHGSVFHPVYGYEYSQRLARPAAFTIALPLYQRSVAPLAQSNSNDGHQKAAADCGQHQEPDQDDGVQVQSVAYPQQYQQAHWTPIIYNPEPVAYNPVVYPSLVGESKVQAWPQRSHVILHAAVPRLAGVPSAYGNHRQQF